MHFVSRRNMLALPVERLVGNSHNNHHHSSSRSRLSLSPDSVTSDSSISGESSDSRSVNTNIHEGHQGHKKSHGHLDTLTMTNVTMSPPPRPSSRETGNSSYSPPSNRKMHHVLINTSCQSVSAPTNTKSSSLVISSSVSSPRSNEPNNDDDDNEEDYHISKPNCRNREPYYRQNLHHENSNTSNTSSRSKSPKINKHIKNSERRTCCNSPPGIVVLGPEGETRNSNAMNINANTSTIVKSEVDTDDRFPKEPSSYLIPVVREPIHIDTEEGHNDNNRKPRSDKFNEEMSANANNTNSTQDEDDHELKVDDDDEDEEDDTNTNNRVTSKVNNSWTSGPRSNSPCGRKDHRVNRNNDDNERTEGTNNSSIDNEDHHHYHKHNHHHHNHHVNNHYHNNSDNSSLGRPPSRPSSSTSSTSSSNLNKSLKHKQQQKPSLINSIHSRNTNFLKFSIDDILRPDFGINTNAPTTPTANKQSTRINGQVFNPFFNITSSESRFHNQNNQKWNSNANFNSNIITKAELPSPSPSSSSVLSLKTKPRDGSVSSADGHRPYRPSSVHCHSEDSNSSSISRLREEVVDDTKVNPPVPKGPLVWPAWVYCTRYSDRPSSGPRSRRIRKNPKDVPEEKRPRTAFTGEQLARLKQEFDENRYLTEKRRQDLARDLKLHENQIKIWFQNKRAKLKKSTGTKNGLAQQLMAQGLYNHSTVPIDEDDEMEMEMGSMGAMGMGMGIHMM